MELVINRGGVELLTVALPDNAQESYNIGSHERKVTMSFERSVFQRLERGDTITIGGITYWYDNEKSTISRNQQTNGFVYNVSFYGREWYWRDILLKSDDKTEIPLHTTAYYHLRLIADCLEASGFGAFNVSTSLSDTHYYVYKDVSVFDALDSLAGVYGAEWWVDGNTIHLGKNEYGTAVLLRDDQEVENISESSSSEKPVTRLYAYGSTKNMLNGERLKMNPPYVDLLPNMDAVDVIESVHYFDEVYPRQQNTITNIRTKEIAGDGDTTMDTVIYEFRDSNGVVLSTEDLLPLPLKVYFETGALIGREFELIIIEEEGETYYQIKYIIENDNYVPRPTFAPAVGDKFVLEGFKAESVMPALIEAARSELTAKALTFIDKIGISKVYDVDARSIICEERDVLLNVGQSVILQSTALGSISTRVRGYDRSLYNPYDCKYEIGDSDKYSRLREIEARQKHEIDMQRLMDTLMGYFADGVVDAVEVARIQAILDAMKSEYEAMKARYFVFGVTHPEWDTYEAIYNALVNAIELAISKTDITVAERDLIESLLAQYREALAALTVVFDMTLLVDLRELHTTITGAQQNLAELEAVMTEMKDVTLKAMEDDFISEAERRSLYAVYVRLDVEQEQLLSDVMYAVNSIYMPELYKQRLLVASNNILNNGASLDQYQQAIADILDHADPHITEYERANYNRTLQIYKRDYTELLDALRDSRLAIDAEIKRMSDERSENVNGGKNLLRNYDQRWDFDFWGGAGVSVEVDLDSTPIYNYRGLVDDGNMIVDEDGKIIEMV